MGRLVAILLALVISAGCAKPVDPGLGRAFDDAQITTEVKTVFLNQPLDSVARIEVETASGVVTLSGRVASKDEEAKAIALARTVKGVVDVKSTLQIE
jgi:hyperosmotically inducible periplasmic protein